MSDNVTEAIRRVKECVETTRSLDAQYPPVTLDDLEILLSALEASRRPVDEEMVARIDAALDTERNIRVYFEDVGRRRLAEKIATCLT